MKIAVCSDLHLEFGDLNLKNEVGADVLILSGDILVAKDIGNFDPTGILENAKGQRLHDFMSRCSFQFPHVIYIMGNHEHYNGDYATSADVLRKFCAEWDNVHFLDKELVKIDDITFIGGTLWTDMNGDDAMTKLHITGMMNDFRIVNNSARITYWRDPDGNSHERTSRFMPEDAVEDHRAMLEYIRTIIEGRYDEKFVVVGHHAPSKASTHPRYKDEQLMNGAYSSNLDDFIIDHPQIKLWTHGHTHEDFDYMVGTTRVVCNPRGYINYEDRADNFKLKVVEV